MTEQSMLDKKAILKADKLAKELVHVPEWGGSVWVQEMTAVQRDMFDQWVMTKKEGVGGMRLRVLIATVVDDSGKPMFSDLDIPDLNKKSSRATTRLSDVGLRLSGRDTESKEDLVKNSKAVPSDDSASDLPSS